MSLNLAYLEERLVATVADRAKTRKDVAAVYAEAVRLRAYDSIDWRRVNQAIVARWSVAALTWIKREAWKLGLAVRELPEVQP